MSINRTIVCLTCIHTWVVELKASNTVCPKCGSERTFESVAGALLGKEDGSSCLLPINAGYSKPAENIVNSTNIALGTNDGMYINPCIKAPPHRPTWDEYFMLMADTISRRATCDRGRSGCVIARDKQILVSGYVGSPVGLPHCDDAGHVLRQVVKEDGNTSTHCMRTVHAEQNAICQAAKLGVPIKGATLYCRMTPCRTCAMLIIQCGIDRVVCEKMYHAGQESIKMFNEAGIEIEHLSGETQGY